MAEMPCTELVRSHLAKKYANAMSPEATRYLAKIDPTNKEQFSAFARMVDRPRFRDLAYEYWIASILSGPWTHMRNVVGNAAYAITEGSVTRAGAGAVDALRSLATGKARTRYASEALPFMFGWARGLPTGVAKGLRHMGEDFGVKLGGKLAEGARGLETTTSLTQVGGALESRVPAWERVSVLSDLLPTGLRRGGMAATPPPGGTRAGRIARGTGRVLTLPLKALGAEDLAFKTMAYTGELHALAWREAIKGGRKVGSSGFLDEVTRLIQDPTEEMIEAANKRAAELTFTDTPSWFGKQINQIRSADPTGVVGRGVVPFVNTPDRLFVRGFEYTPAGVYRGLFETGKEGVKLRKNLDPELVARGTIGTMVGLGLWGLYKQGRLVGDTQGAGPKDRGSAQAMYAQGGEPYSLLLGDQDAGGYWVPFKMLDPLGLPLGLAVAAIEAAESGDEQSADQAALGFVQQVMQLGLEKGYMTTVADLFELASGFGDTEGINRFLIRQVGGLQPFSGATRQAATMMDDRVVVPETIGEQFRSQIPGLRQGVDARLDPTGDTARYAESAMPDLFAPPGTPLAFRRAETDPVYRALLDLGIRPAGSQETAERRLSSDVKGKIEAAMRGRYWNQMSDDAKRRRIKNILAGGR